MEYGKQIQQARKQAGLSQAKLAKEVRVTTDHLGKIERGIIPPLNARAAVKLCEFLNLNPQLFLMAIARHRLSDFPKGTELKIPPIKEESEIKPLVHRVNVSEWTIRYHLEEDGEAVESPNVVFRTENSRIAMQIYHGIASLIRTIGTAVKTVEDQK